MVGEFVSTPDPEWNRLPGEDHKPVILVVGDDPGMRECVRAPLTHQYALMTAFTAKQSLDLAQRNRPDLVLAHASLPDMSGSALAATIRRDPRLSMVPVILILPREEPGPRIAPPAAEEADDSLALPFTPRELIARIEAQLKIARLRREAELQSALRRELQQARQFAWEALEHIPDSFATFDRNYNVTYMNAAASQIAAASGVAHIGRNFWEIYPILLGTPVEQHFRRAMEQRVPVEFEQYFRTPDAEKWFQFQPGEGLIVYMRETTEARRTEQALLRSEQLAAAGRMAASVAHEINNPLEAVTNLLYLVKMDQSLSSNSRDLLEVADRELQRLSHITSRSLKFYRQRTAPTRTPIDDLLESVLFFHETEMRMRGIELERRYHPAAAVLCLAGEIQQVLTNLISNALEAMVEKGRLLVGVRAARDRSGREGVAVTIADNGAGMDRYTINRLFHPFVTTKGESGTGLGLWVSKGILDKHHGAIRVRSRMGKGTVFRIFLPLDTTTPPNDVSS